MIDASQITSLPITDHGSRNMSNMKDKSVSVVGLGYLGLPLAKAFSKHLKVIGFDIDEEKTKNLGNNKNDKGDNIEFIYQYIAHLSKAIFKLKEKPLDLDFKRRSGVINRRCREVFR